MAPLNLIDDFDSPDTDQHKPLCDCRFAPLVNRSVQTETEKNLAARGRDRHPLINVAMDYLGHLKRKVSTRKVRTMHLNEMGIFNLDVEREMPFIVGQVTDDRDVPTLRQRILRLPLAGERRGLLRRRDCGSFRTTFEARRSRPSAPGSHPRMETRIPRGDPGRRA